MMARIKFLNTYIDSLTKEEALEETDKLIREKKCSYIVTPNIDHIVILENDQEFAEVYSKANLILADGKPLIWISKMLKRPIKEKISGSDFFPQLCRLCAEKGYRVFILGAAEGVAEKATQNLCKRINGLQICGTYSPRIGFEKDEKELEKIKALLEEADPDVLAVSLGSPKGEKFIYKHLDEYNIPLAISIGATIDFEAGKVKRAPRWMSEHGFEWLFRITQDPKRLIRRYWNDAIKIIPIVRKYSN